MPHISLSKLKDNAFDVDADVRFMVLEDFKKLVNDPRSKTLSVSSLKGFTPVLFKLLNDPNSDVQSQAVKSFEPLIKLLPDDTILELFDQLSDYIMKTTSDDGVYKSFARSIPSMALHTIFQSNYKFSNTLSRSIINMMLPKLLNQTMSIDTIEVLIDLIDSLGDNLHAEEVFTLAQRLINISFNGKGVIVKRSEAAYDDLLGCLKVVPVPEDIFNKLMIHVFSESGKTDLRSSAVSIKLQLYSVTFNGLSMFDKTNEISSLDANLISKVFVELLQYLNLPGTVRDSLANDEDLDYDELIKENSLRENVFNSLIDFVYCMPYESIINYIEPVMSVIEAFISYRPLAFGESDDGSEFFDDGDDSQIEFSDDNNDEDENDISWKLRLQACTLTKILVQRFPSVLPSIYARHISLIIDSVGDRNYLVANSATNLLIVLISSTSPEYPNSYYAANKSGRKGSDVSMVTTSDPVTLFVNEVIPILEQRLFDNWLIESNLDRFPVFLNLIDVLLRFFHDALSDEFLSKLLVKLQDLKVKTNGSMEFLNLYRQIIESYHISQIPLKFIDHIIWDLITFINSLSSFYNVVSESISISSALFQKIGILNDDSISYRLLTDLFYSIIRKVNYKQYSSDLRQQSLVGLRDYCISIKFNSMKDFEEVVEILREALTYEITVKVALESLCLILAALKNNLYFLETQEFKTFLVQKIYSFILSADETLYAHSLQILSLLSDHSKLPNLDTTFFNLLNFLVQDGTSLQFQLFPLVFKIMAKNLEPGIMNEQKLTIFAQKVVNNKLTDVDDYDVSSMDLFIRKLCDVEDNPDLFYILLDNLNLELFTSSTILGIISVEKRLFGEIEKREFELIDYLGGHKVASMSLLFDIQYLGNVGSNLQLEKVKFEHFLKLMNESEEVIKMASSRSIGFYALINLSKHMPELLKYYLESRNLRKYLLTSIKQILNSGKATNEDKKLIWETMWTTLSSQGDFTNLLELRASGDVFAKIILMDTSGTYLNLFIQESPQNNALIYTGIVVMKHLINSLSPLENVKLQDLLIKSLKSLDIANIDIRQVHIGTLLTALHNKPEIVFPILNSTILPKIFLQLTASPEFKKTIPMGPYKYVTDEGLEIRKLCYEFLYAIISLDPRTIEMYDINVDAIGKNIITRGLVDEEADIVILSSINLVSLLSLGMAGDTHKVPLNVSTDSTGIYKNGTGTSSISGKIASFLVESPDLLHILITNLRQVFSKKLRAKASTQESESHEEAIKSMAKLVKSINEFLTVHSYLVSEWSSFYVEIRSVYGLHFNALELEP